MVIPVTGLKELFDRCPKVFIGFSGGKESIICAHLCEPWRDQVMLVYVNSGISLREQPGFVRSFGERFHMVELTAPNVFESWNVHGLPVDVVPVRNALGDRWPRIQAWPLCCARIRNAPLHEYVVHFPGSAMILGQRLSDQSFTHGGLISAQVPGIECFLPLWDWTDQDVWDYIAEHKLTLPIQYGRGLRTSCDCALCPASLDRDRLDYLDKYAPDMAASVRQAASGLQLEAQLALDETAAVLGLHVRRLSKNGDRNEGRLP